jgi:uncharacterized protein YegL
MSSLADIIGIANPEEPHNATVLLLDVSGSMAEFSKIKQLNEGINIFKKDLTKDELARKRVDLAVVTFGGTVEVVNDFSSIDEFNPTTLGARGQTPMGEAILNAIDLIETRKADYKRKGIDYYRPWIFMITDGEPTDMQPGDPLWMRVVENVHGGETSKKFLFWAVGVEPANMSLLKQIAPPNRPPVMLKQGKFAELFEWLSKSQSKVSASRVGDQVSMEPPTAWCTIATD